MVRNVKEILNDFLDYTSLHGLGRLGAASVLPHKLFWTFAFFGCASVCFYQVYRLGIQFESEPTTTTLEIDYDAIDFPKVTICNMNPLRFSEVQRREKLFQVIEAAANNSGLDISHFINGTLPNFNYQVELEWPSWEPTLDEVRQLFMSRMSDMDISSSTALYGEFILRCYYNGYYCESSMWKIVRDEYYGNCFMFYPNVTVEAASPFKGLTLALNVEADEYVPFITDSVGVVIDVKRSYGTPTPKTTGMAISTGLHTSVALWQHCIDTCLETASVDRCKCANSMKFVSGSTQLCNSFDEISCFTRSVNSESSCGHCKDQCRSMEYIPSVSIRSWPSPPADITLREVFQYSLNYHNINKNMSTKDFKTNFVSVDIYISSLKTERVTENLAYTDENFLSDIGGQLGLWIGMSVQSLAELCELVILIVVGLVVKRRAVKKIDVKPMDQNL